MTNQEKIEKDILSVYGLQLALGDDIYIKNMKIINKKIVELKTLMSNPYFMQMLALIDLCRDSLEDYKNVEVLLSYFLECDIVSYNENLGVYIARYNLDNEPHVEKLNIEDIQFCIGLLSILYQRNNNKSKADIDEDMASDENTKQKIRVINERNEKFKGGKGKGVSMSSMISSCASLGLGGYNFETIQKLTLFQIVTLLNTHNNSVRFNGYYSGLYSQVSLKEVDSSDIYWISEN